MMAPNRFTFTRRSLQIGVPLVFCVSVILLLYYVNSIMKGILRFPNQLWFCSVGFELTPSSATSAFSCEAGTEATTNGPIFFLDGNEAYKQTMFHLSTDANYRLTTDEIENLSAMFSKQIAASQERTQNYVNSATVSFPHLPGLMANNSGNDVMRRAFAGIEILKHVAYEQVLDSRKKDNNIHPANAILAAHGLGLCQPWNREEDCECENHQKLPTETYLLAAYYAHGVEIVLTEETTSAYDIPSHTYNNYTLGRSAKPSDEHLEEAYWDDMRNFFRGALNKHPHLAPRRGILYGDQSEDVEFQAVLIQVLHQVLGSEHQPQWVLDGVDPTFAGALGAAELLKRKRFRKLCTKETADGN